MRKCNRLEKVPILKRTDRKNLPHCNHGGLITVKSSTLKSSENLRADGRFFAGPFSANNDNSHSGSQLQTMKTLVSRCEPVCAPPHPLYLRKSETRCWGICARLCQNMILPLKLRNCSVEDAVGRLGRVLSLPTVLLLPVSGFSEAIAFGKMPGQGQRV